MMKEVTVFCQNKNQFISLQRYLINVFKYLWADGSKVWVPHDYDTFYKNGIIININKNDFVLTVSNPRMFSWEYTYYEYIEECKKSRSWSKLKSEIRRNQSKREEVSIFINDIFDGII